MKAALICFILFVVCAVEGRHLRREVLLDDEGEADEAAALLRLEHADLVVREGHKLMIPCVYGGEDLKEGAHGLQWLTSGHKRIDGETSVSVFTISLHEHGTAHPKKTLHFSAIAKRDEGTYTCEARTRDGRVFTKTARVSVLDPIDWASHERRAGGLVGEPLTINCNAKGRPEPQIQITDEEGEPLDEDLFTIAGNEVTVGALTKEYNGKVVNCMALQVLTDLDTTSTEQRSVTIDVWYAPEFTHPKIDRHTVLERTAIIPCNVTASNPPARHFNFFRSNVLLNDVAKYEQVMDVLENSAYLKIKEVNEGDLGEYRCEVNNGKAKSAQIINLKEANPPDEVKVELLEVKRNGLVWSIQTDADDELPATHFDIRYIRQELLDKEDPSDSAAIEAVWTHHSSKIHKAIDSSGRYEMGGLRTNTPYAFRFRAESEAGVGPAVELVAATDGKQKLPPADGEEDEDDSGMAGSSCSRWLQLLVLVVAAARFIIN